MSGKLLYCRCTVYNNTNIVIHTFRSFTGNVEKSMQRCLLNRPSSVLSLLPTVEWRKHEAWSVQQANATLPVASPSSDVICFSTHFCCTHIHSWPNVQMSSEFWRKITCKTELVTSMKLNWESFSWSSNNEQEVCVPHRIGQVTFSLIVLLSQPMCVLLICNHTN